VGRRAREGRDGADVTRGIAPRRSALAAARSDAKRVARHTSLSWVGMSLLTLSSAGGSVDTEADRGQRLRHGDPT
jgi:hypothetical protein